MNPFKKNSLIIFLILILLPILNWADYIRGIYLTQYTLESTKALKYLIQNAKATGINTFVVDSEYVSKYYAKNIQLLKDNNIRYVARVVIFPHGGTHDQVTSQKYWASRQNVIKQAATAGADYIQLDYIRYNTQRKQSDENAKNILSVISWFRDQLKGTNSKLQIAVFGETCMVPSRAIGQNIQVFANNIDSLSPMVYPSHYYPYVFHSQRPYDTVHDSLIACKEQFNNKPPFKVIPYIEVYNVRYNIPQSKRPEYIYQQIKAVQDSNVDGWYAWSANNKYSALFKMLSTYKVK